MLGQARESKVFCSSTPHLLVVTDVVRPFLVVPPSFLVVPSLLLVVPLPFLVVPPLLLVVPPSFLVVPLPFLDISDLLLDIPPSFCIWKDIVSSMLSPRVHIGVYTWNYIKQPY